MLTVSVSTPPFSGRLTWGADERSRRERVPESSRAVGSDEDEDEDEDEDLFAFERRGSPDERRPAPRTAQSSDLLAGGRAHASRDAGARRDGAPAEELS